MEPRPCVPAEVPTPEDGDRRAMAAALSDAAAVEVEHCVPEIIRAIFDAKTGSSLRVI